MPDITTFPSDQARKTPLALNLVVITSKTKPEG
jgi:hypothetical protein